MQQAFMNRCGCNGIAKILAACWLAIGPMLMVAQAPARLYADSSRVETGNPYVLHLEAPAGSGMPDSVNFEAWSEVVPAQNIIKTGVWRKEQNKLVCEWTVLFFDADTLTLPPLQIHLLGGDSVETNEWQVEVYATPSPDDLNDLAPIKDIHEEAALWTDYLPWLVGILLVLCLMAVLYWVLARRQKKGAQSRLIAQSPHELALRKLTQLQEKSWWTSGKVKEHCAELTFILREYFEKRYRIPALESTSEELLHALQNVSFPAEYQPDLKYVLEQADLAKFAKGLPADEFYNYSFEFAKALIQNTTPKAPDVHPDHPETT